MGYTVICYIEESATSHTLQLLVAYLSSYLRFYTSCHTCNPYTSIAYLNPLFFCPSCQTHPVSLEQSRYISQSDRSRCLSIVFRTQPGIPGLLSSEETW